MTPPIVSIFHTDPRTLRADPGLAARLRECGIRHVEMQVFRSPANDQDYATWERNWEKQIGAEIDWCVDNDWRIIARLDDAVRTPVERKAMLKWDGDTMYHVAKRLRNCAGMCDGIEVVDEIQQDHREYPVADLLHFFAAGPPLAFPGHAPQQFERLKMANSYISRQWTWTTCRVGADRINRLRGSLSGLENETRPICAMIDVSGPYYIKRVPGDHYQTGKSSAVRLWDRLIENNRRPPSGLNIRKQFMTAWALGARRFRCYALDTFWKQHRASAPIGAKCQTGIHLDDERWPWVERAVKEIHQMATKPEKLSRHELEEIHRETEPPSGF